MRKRERRIGSLIEALEHRCLLSTVVVNSVSTEGTGQVTLQDAVATANASNGGTTTIQFDSHVFASRQTVTASFSLPASAGQVNIAGPASGIILSGGEISIDQGASLNLSNAEITGAISDPAILFDGITQGYVNGNGIINSGKLYLTNCTVDGNSSGSGDTNGTQPLHPEFTGIGAGILNNNTGNMTLVNCTISGNTASIVPANVADGYSPSYGGGISNDGTATLIGDTITGNAGTTGGGIDNTGTLTLGNCIVAGNAGQTGVDVDGSVKSLGHNLIGQTDGSSGWIASDLVGTQARPLPAGLGALTNNGGPAPTQLPFANSAALNTGAASILPSDITTDERGLRRVVAGQIDIGAVQLQGAATGTQPQIKLSLSSHLLIPDQTTATLSATVTKGSSPARGTVVFFENGSEFASGTLDANGTFSTSVSSDFRGEGLSLAIGKDLLQAIFTSTSPAVAVASAGVPVTVAGSAPTQASTTVLISESQPIAAMGQPVTFTARVPRIGRSWPTGTVSFIFNGNDVGDVALNARGVAKVTTTSTLASGTVSANYPGDDNYAAGVSSDLNLQVNNQPSGTAVLLNAASVPNQYVVGYRPTGGLRFTLTNELQTTTTGQYQIQAELIAPPNSNGSAGTTQVIASRTIGLHLPPSHTISLAIPYRVAIAGDLAGKTPELKLLITRLHGATETTDTGISVPVHQPVASIATSGFFDDNIPDYVTAGQRVRAAVYVPVQNSGNIIARGVTTITLQVQSLDSSSTYISPPVVTVRKRVTLGPGQTRTITMRLAVIPKLPAGTYGLHATVTDPINGTTSTSDSTFAFQVN
jgi:hypothetical protein